MDREELTGLQPVAQIHQAADRQKAVNGIRPGKGGRAGRCDRTLPLIEANADPEKEEEESPLHEVAGELYRGVAGH